MQRFIERQNIADFERLLAQAELSEKSRRFVREQLLASRRRLATLTAAAVGVRPKRQAMRDRAPSGPAPSLSRKFQAEFQTAAKPLLLIDPGPGLHIVEANKVYAAATMVDAGRVAGERIFNVFPDNPGDPFADGVANLFASLRVVAETGQAHVMLVQRYDVRDERGKFVERHWQPLNSPVLDDRDNVAFILHQAIDVSARYSPPNPRQAP
ncbi:diguanylate cyclase [Bradyrhizobium sp.]|uniref:diguanylate cyclase n=1 Tax=Bradyrhizobium sp. TaxID=376 RepID=UPI0026217092|nr:diguanylate cyclase [Bradyrhizobium sp.]